MESTCYLIDVDPLTFDAGSYLRSIEPTHIDLMLQDSACRRALTKHDPLLWAIIYFGKSITDHDTGVMSFADLHFDLCRLAYSWAFHHEPMENRHAVLAPRDAGKSTWLFKILPLWALAHGHVKFVAAFTSTGPQAHKWSTNVKRELDNNELLRIDYPDLCTPAIRQSTGRAVMDNQSTYSARSGATLFAAGIDSSNLGLNIDDRRPDLLIFDDIEPDESNYSSYLKQQRLTTLIDTCFGMNLKAHVMMVGTVTMMGSIFHDLVLRNDGEETDDNKWITEQKINIHHFEPFVTEPDGNRRSVWPFKWTLKFLEGIEHTVSFAKNFLNRPIGMDGAYWTMRDISYGSLECPAIKVLSIDPAVKDKKTNDFTAMSVVAYDPHQITNKGVNGCYEVIEAIEMRVTPGQPFVKRVEGLLAVYPDIHAILIETNQGGMLWMNLLYDLPVQVWEVTATEHKWVRAAKLLNFYQEGRVTHRRKHVRLERQQLAYPKVMHDDLLDSVGQAVLELERRYSMSGAPSVSNW